MLTSKPIAAQEQPNSMHPPSMEDLDVARHREIITKAVSAMLLLTLKWLKVSREHNLLFSIQKQWT